MDRAVDLCNTIANKLNAKSQSSELAKLNKNGYLKTASNELLEVVKKGLYYSRLKNGIFDITIKPVSQLWDFKKGVIPKNDAIKTALASVDYKNIIISNGSIKLKNNCQIDLGAIAKGYIADKISDFLIKNGIKSALINLGGNVTVVGDKDDDAFNIGIQTPFDNSTCATIKAKDMSVVTSGIYQRYTEKDGVIYHHLLNTKSGMPEQNGLNSVTIITRSSADADALSTLCFLLGKDTGMAYIERLKNTEAVFIDKNNKLHLTSGLVLKDGIITL